MNILLTESINKDFGLALPGMIKEEELINRLAEYINQLINTNFPELIRLLYRVDINESRLKDLLKEKTGEDAGKIIAGLVIDRQIEKNKSRSSFPPASDIPEDEKW